MAGTQDGTHHSADSGDLPQLENQPASLFVARPSKNPLSAEQSSFMGWHPGTGPAKELTRRTLWRLALLMCAFLPRFLQLGTQLSRNLKTVLGIWLWSCPSRDMLRFLVGDFANATTATRGNRTGSTQVANFRPSCFAIGLSAKKQAPTETLLTSPVLSKGTAAWHPGLTSFENALLVSLTSREQTSPSTNKKRPHKLFLRALTAGSNSPLPSSETHLPSNWCFPRINSNPNH